MNIVLIQVIHHTEPSPRKFNPHLSTTFLNYNVDHRQTAYAQTR